MKQKTIAYCLNCKKYFDMNLTDGQGFICCPECKGAYQFNVMQLDYSKEEGYCYNCETKNHIIVCLGIVIFVLIL